MILLTNETRISMYRGNTTVKTVQQTTRLRTHGMGKRTSEIPMV